MHNTDDAHLPSLAFNQPQSLTFNQRHVIAVQNLFDDQWRQTVKMRLTLELGQPDTCHPC